MPWFRRHAARPSPPQGRTPADRWVLPASPLVCAGCGRLLDGDPDEDPTGESGSPICGECERNRDIDAMLEGGELEP